jgi:hypothetical protein
MTRLEILQLISEQTPSVALSLVVMYFYNKLVLDMLKERKDWVDTQRLERLELLTVTKASIEANVNSANHIHRLSGEVQKAAFEIQRLANLLGMGKKRGESDGNQ